MNRLRLHLKPRQCFRRHTVSTCARKDNVSCTAQGDPFGEVVSPDSSAAGSISIFTSASAPVPETVTRNSATSGNRRMTASIPAGKDVVSADGDHVVVAAQDAAFHAGEPAAAAAVIAGEANLVVGPIADQRARPSGRGWSARVRLIGHRAGLRRCAGSITSAMQSAFVEVDAAGVCVAFETEAPISVMPVWSIDACAPLGFDAVADLGDASAGLAGDDRVRDARRRRGRSFTVGDLGHVKGVGGRAADEVDLRDRRAT